MLHYSTIHTGRSQTGSAFHRVEHCSELRICSQIFYAPLRRQKKVFHSEKFRRHNWPKIQTTTAHTAIAAATYSSDLISSSCSFLLNILFTFSCIRHSLAASRIQPNQNSFNSAQTTSLCIQKSFTLRGFLENILGGQLNVRFVPVSMGCVDRIYSFDGCAH